MREILFRAKRKDNGEWIYGNIFIPDYEDKPTEILIGTNVVRISYEVVPETVGEYTGLIDKNGTKIYDGDKVKYRNSIFEVRLYNGCWVIWNHKHAYEFEKYHYLSTYADLIEVIGNIHDNSELLKESE